MGHDGRRPLLSVVCWCEMLLNANVCCSLHPTDANSGAFTSAAAAFCSKGIIFYARRRRCIGVFAGINECNSRRIYLQAHTWETFNSRIEYMPPLLELWMLMPLLHAWLMRALSRLHRSRALFVLAHCAAFRLYVHKIATHIICIAGGKLAACSLHSHSIRSLIRTRSRLKGAKQLLA